ncbi:MAG: FHA domain-containing protein [Chloroflexi bacterium]|nr:FHA domain-containing protein [Chloroflexota bacterium]MCC6893089.1 FHA domain-containing protein [Anaerolineae bacterium]
MNQHICPRCQFANAQQSPVCVECGQLLTDNLDATRPLSYPGSRHQPIHTLTFHIGDDQLAISLKMAERLILGRQSNRMADRPDLDLARFQAAEHGISRIHATLECNEAGVYLMDLGSRNGTFVNGEALAAFSPCYLRDGDLVRFGKLTLTLALRQDESGDNRFAVSTHARSKTGKLEESIRLMRV